MKVATRFVNPKREPIDAKKSKTLAFTNMIYFLDDLCENIDATLDTLKRGEQAQPKVMIKSNNYGSLEQQDQLTKGDDGLKPQNFFTEKVDNSEVFFKTYIASFCA